jgi:hypothetical protein
MSFLLLYRVEAPHQAGKHFVSPNLAFSMDEAPRDSSAAIQASCAKCGVSATSEFPLLAARPKKGQALYDKFICVPREDFFKELSNTKILETCI